MYKEFKIGDWVRYGLRVLRITDGTSPTGHCACNNNGYAYKSSDLEKWYPIDGEWCAFWYNNSTNYQIAKFGSFVHAPDQFHSKYNNDWDNVAPKQFIQTLKDG